MIVSYGVNDWSGIVPITSDEEPETTELLAPKFLVDKSRATIAADTCPKCHQRENTEPWGYCTECGEKILATDLSES